MSSKTQVETKELGCDFCNSTKPKWIYPTDSFVQTMLPGSHIEEDVEMSGSWLACRTCHNIIEKKSPQQLTEHSLNSYGVTSTSKVYKQAYNRIEALHAEFYLYRKGPAFKASKDYLDCQ